MDDMDLTTIIEHKNWADQVFLDYVADLSDDDYTKSFPGYDNNIAKIMMHILQVNWSWMTLLTDQNFEDQPDWDHLTRQQVYDAILDYNQQIVEYIEQNDVKEKVEYDEAGKTVQTTAENILFNFTTHNAYHRGQLAIYLRLVGLDEIKETDFNPYIYELQM